MSLRTIEALVCAYLGGWERQLSASKIADMLGVSREHASRKIMSWARKTFRLSNPEGSRGTVYFENGLAAMPPGLQTPRELMTNLPGLALGWGEGFRAPEIVKLSDCFAGEGDPDKFEELYSAMCRRESLQLLYRAKSGDQSLRFSPHTLIDLPHRPHFRGHAFWNRDGDETFIDLVPARVSSVTGRSKEEFVGMASDSIWNKRSDLTLVLSDDLPDEIKAAIIQEWGYQLRKINGELTLTFPRLREPLIQYVKDAILWRTFHGKSYQVWWERPPR